MTKIDKREFFFFVFVFSFSWCQEGCDIPASSVGPDRRTKVPARNHVAFNNYEVSSSGRQTQKRRAPHSSSPGPSPPAPPRPSRSPPGPFQDPHNGRPHPLAREGGPEDAQPWGEGCRLRHVEPRRTTSTTPPPSLQECPSVRGLIPPINTCLQCTTSGGAGAGLRCAAPRDTGRHTKGTSRPGGISGRKALAPLSARRSTFVIRPFTPSAGHSCPVFAANSGVFSTDAFCPPRSLPVFLVAALSARCRKTACFRPRQHHTQPPALRNRV